MFDFIDENSFNYYEPNPIIPVPEKSIIPPAIDTILNEIQKEDWYTQQLTILVMGASGDLAKKKTYPALFELWKNNLLSSSSKSTSTTSSTSSTSTKKQTIIHGYARHQYTDLQQFRQSLKPFLLKQLNESDKNDTSTGGEQLVDDFLSICYYTHGTSYSDWETIRNMLLFLDNKYEATTTAAATTNSNNNNNNINHNINIPIHNLLVYMAIPPNIFGEACQSIRFIDKVPGFVRIVIEKPFGRDTDSCQELLRTLHDQAWDESSLYRIDHYLGKEIVQSIPSFRRHNYVWLHPLWHHRTIQSVHIILKEPFGTDGRGGYFDPYGIIRDVIQNHLLQVLTLVAMDVPLTEWTSHSIRDAKVNVLNNISPVTIEQTLLGQYNGYKDDVTITNKQTTTPTYACIKLLINNMDAWTNVPFILEAGKALDEQLCAVRIQFHSNNITTTDTDTNTNNNNTNSLVFRLQPHPSVYFTTNMKTPGFSDTTVSTLMGIDYEHCVIPEAYTKLVLDVLRGKQINFVRNDELISAWKIFTPLLHLIDNNTTTTNIDNNINNKYTPLPYEQGTDGPKERLQFLQSMGLGSVTLPTLCAL